MKKRGTGYGMISLLAAVCFALCPAMALGDMIRGLDVYPVVTAQEASAFGERSGAVKLVLGDNALAYDSVSNTYFVPQDRDTAAFDGEIGIEEAPGFSYFICPREGFDKQSALAHSLGLTVYGVSEEMCLSSEVIFTALPVIMIDTASKELPGDEDEAGSIAVYTADEGEIALEQSPIEINLRGNTSRWLPKKSYRVKIVDEQGFKRDMAFGLLREDDDWIFNPMYADTSKIREPLAYAFWEQVNSSGQMAASSRMTFAEVFFHGEYWGLYGVQERIDRKQVDADRRAGILYKVFSNEKPTVEQLLGCEDPVSCEGFEVKFAGDHIENPWRGAAAYMSFLEGGEAIGGAALSMRNVIDYGLWAMFVQAHDCHFKNQFLHAVYTGDSGYTMVKIPWDLNHTFGDMWNGEDKEANYTRYYIGRIVKDGAFEKLIESGDAEVYRAIQARYAQLREQVFTEENVAAMARALHEPMYAAIVRDGKRWPQCGMGDGNEDNIRDIVISVRTVLPLMDDFIADLGQAE